MTHRGPVRDIIWSTFLEKVAFYPEVLGVVAGRRPGTMLAGQTAAALAPEGRVTRSEDTAKAISTVTVPAGALGALAVTHGLNLPHRLGDVVGDTFGQPARDATRVLVPFSAAVLGGLGAGTLTGAGVGAVQQLRGPLRKQKAPATVEGDPGASILVEGKKNSPA